MSPDGQDVRRVTASPGWDGNPAWSADGETIAFTREIDGVKDLWTVRPDGSHLRRLTDDPFANGEPSWSPDGATIAFVSDRDMFGHISGLRSVYVVDAGGGEVSRVTDVVVTDSAPVWLDQTTLIVAGIAVDSADFELLQVDVATGEAVRLADAVGVADPAVSPGGSQIAFVRVVGERSSSVSQVDVLDLPVGEIRTVAAGLEAGRGLAFSPEGDRVLLGADGCGQVLCVFSLGEDQSDPLEGNPELPGGLQVREPDWAADAPVMGEPVVTAGNESPIGGPADTRSHPDRPQGSAVVVPGARINNPPPPDPTVQVSGFWGGGFANVTAIATRSGGGGAGFSWLLTGGDTNGVHRSYGTSNQWGDDWEPRNKGLVNPFLSRSIAAIAAHPDPTSSAVYAASSGGFHVSTDNGKTWDTPHFVGNEPEFIGTNAGGDASGTPMYNTHPRSIGRLIVVNWKDARTPHETIVYAGSATDGVWRTTDDGDTWNRIALEGHHIRAVISVPDPADPTDPDKEWLLVASLGVVADSGNGVDLGDGNGIWRIKDPDCTGNLCANQVFRVWGTDNDVFQPEELVYDPLDDRVWCACSKKGIRYADQSGDYGSWSQYNGWGTGGNPVHATAAPQIWSSIAVADYNGDEGSDVIVGASDSGVPGTGVELMRWSEADVTTQAVWTDLVSSTQKTAITSAEVCSTGEDFWIGDDIESQGTLLAHSRFQPGYIETGFDRQLYVTGDGALWRLKRPSTSATYVERTWCAAVQNLSSTANRGIAVDDTGGNAVLANTDFDAFTTTDAFDNVNRISVPNTTVAFDVHYTTSNNEVVFGSGDRDTDNVPSDPVADDPEDVYASDSNGATTTSLDLDLDSATVRLEARRVIGVSSIERGAGSENEIYLAAVSGAGVWRRNSGSSPSWTEVIAKVDAVEDDTFDRVDIHWDDQWVFLLDRSTGLWRSDDWGKSGSWDRIWTPAVATNPEDSDLPTTGSNRRFIGFLAVDPTDPDLVFISAQNDVYEISGATTCTTTNCTATSIQPTGLGKPGPIAVSQDGEHLFVATRVEANGDDAEIWRYDDIDGTPTWHGAPNPLVDATDDVYPHMGFTLTGMAVSADRELLISTQGIGVIRVLDAYPAP